jgi:hypothetical protein
MAAKVWSGLIAILVVVALVPDAARAQAKSRASETADARSGRGAGADGDAVSAVATGAGTGTDQDALRETAEAAVSLESAAHGVVYWAIAAAVIAFIVAAFALRLLSTRWIGSWRLQWPVLLVVPTATAVGVMVAAADGIRARLDDMQTDLLGQVPVLGPAQGEAARYASTLKDAAEHGGLWRALALYPAIATMGIAFVMLIVVWVWTNRRVLTFG